MVFSAPNMELSIYSTCKRISQKLLRNIVKFLDLIYLELGVPSYKVLRMNSEVRRSICTHTHIIALLIEGRSFCNRLGLLSFKKKLASVPEKLAFIIQDLFKGQGEIKNKPHQSSEKITGGAHRWPGRPGRRPRRQQLPFQNRFAFVKRLRSEPCSHPATHPRAATARWRRHRCVFHSAPQTPPCFRCTRQAMRRKSRAS